MSSITTSKLKDSYLSTDFVTNIGTTDEILQNNDNLVTSEGIYNSLSLLSNNLVGLLQPKATSETKAFNFSDVSAIAVENVPDSQRIIVQTNDGFELSTVSGYSDGSLFFRIPSVVSLSSGRKIAVFDIRWNSKEDIGKTDKYDLCIGEIQSDDGGSSWSEPKCIVDWLYPDYDPSRALSAYLSGASDPGILYDEAHNVIMVFALGGYGIAGRNPSILSSGPYSDLSSYEYQQLIFTYSTDEGNTWSKPTTVTSKIFDANGTTQEWARTYRFCYTACTAGIMLKRQPDESNNGKLLLPMQLIQRQTGGGDAWYYNLRTTFAEVQPTYDEDNNIVDIKLMFIHDSLGNDVRLGEISGGANECSLCEGPNGELVTAVRGYYGYANPNGLYSTSTIFIRLYKASSLYQDWTIVGDAATDYSSGEDKICTLLQTAGCAKPGLAWSDKIGKYVISYVLMLSNDVTRKNIVARCSSDLLNWKFLASIELKYNLGYVSFAPQPDDAHFLECIYEAYNDGLFSGDGKQLKYASFKIDGGNLSMFSTFSTDLSAIASSNSSIQGFVFNLSKATKQSIISPYSTAAYPVDRLRVFWGAFSASLANIYCVLYASNSDTALPLAYSNIVNLSTDQNYPDYFVEFVFDVKVAIDPYEDNEYFVRFFSGTSIPDGIKNKTLQRGAIGGSGNVVSVTTFNSVFNTLNFMKVYRNGSVMQEASYPLSLLFLLA